uniref:Uncharacterized protein n=1 Tax=Parascaris univalens TaxID=6257 RepID=A0A915B9D0_PARUN
MFARFQSFLNYFLYSGARRTSADELRLSESISYNEALYIWSTTIAISSAILLSTCTKRSSTRKPSDDNKTSNHARHINRLNASEDGIAFSKTGGGTQETACTVKTKETNEQEGEESAAEKQVGLSEHLKHREKLEEGKQEQMMKRHRRYRNKNSKTNDRENEMHDDDRKKRIKGERQKNNNKKDKKQSLEEVPEGDENYPKPRTFVKGAKDKLIAKGSRAGRHEYQTMDDVVSDWGSENEKEKEANENANAKSLRENRSHEQADAQNKGDRGKQLPKRKDCQGRQ